MKQTQGGQLRGLRFVKTTPPHPSRHRCVAGLQEDEEGDHSFLAALDQRLLFIGSAVRILKSAVERVQWNESIKGVLLCTAQPVSLAASMLVCELEESAVENGMS